MISSVAPSVRRSTLVWLALALEIDRFQMAREKNARINSGEDDDEGEDDNEGRTPVRRRGQPLGNCERWRRLHGGYWLFK